MAGLKQLEALPHIGNVRGKGLMALVEVVEDKASKKSFEAAAGIGAKMQAASRKRGVIVRCNDNALIMSPPLVISPNEIEHLVNALGETLQEVLG